MRRVLMVLVMACGVAEGALAQTTVPVPVMPTSGATALPLRGPVWYAPAAGMAGSAMEGDDFEHIRLAVRRVPRSGGPSGSGPVVCCSKKGAIVGAAIGAALGWIVSYPLYGCETQRQVPCGTRNMLLLGGIGAGIGAFAIPIKRPNWPDHDPSPWARHDALCGPALGTAPVQAAYSDSLAGFGRLRPASDPCAG